MFVGLRPGLGSAVPAGLILQSMVLTQILSPYLPAPYLAACSVGAIAVVQDNLPALRIFLQHEGEDSIRVSASCGGSFQMKISSGDGVIGVQRPDCQIAKS